MKPRTTQIQAEHPSEHERVFKIPIEWPQARGHGVGIGQVIAEHGDARPSSADQSAIRSATP
jgi:hypothetical protein